MKKHKNNNNHVNLRRFQPKTCNQEKYIESLEKNIITICNGPSGSGKTFCAIGHICQKLINDEIRKILISRSIVSCGNTIGILPGTVDDKIFHYMIPLVQYLEYFLGTETYQDYTMQKRINVYPIELIKGHTYNNTMMILDETQNCTPQQIKLFMTRIGINSKMVLIGDKNQCDIKNNGLKFMLEHFGNNGKIGMINLQKEDILRNSIIPDVIEIFEKNNI